jgi:hypothetical protein
VTQQIELTLDTNIVSVSGYVNGEGVTFTLTGATGNRGIWSAEVAQAEDQVYRITITATNSLGVFSQLSTTIYYGLHLVTDRTQADVDRATNLARKGWENMSLEERLEWESGMKGAYNYTDLNRVQSAVRFLRDRLMIAGYPVTISDHKTWMVNDAPTQTDMENYLADVRAIRSVFALPANTPQVPNTMARLNHVGANNIELILAEIDRLSADIVPHVVQSGEIYGGEWH